MRVFMKSLLITILTVGFLGEFTQAATGGLSDGGGGAYVCRRANGKILYSMLVDLWESENVAYKWSFGAGKLKIKYDNETPPEQQFEYALVKLATLDEGMAEIIRQEWAKIHSNINDLSEEVSIALPQDLKAGYFPTGCPPEGMMYFNGTTDQLDVRRDIFSSLKSKTDVAAAWMHEAAYKVLRDSRYYGVGDSSSIPRHLVACLFSASNDCLVPDKSFITPEPPFGAPKFRCKGTFSEFEIFPQEAIPDFWNNKMYFGDYGDGDMRHGLWQIRTLKHPFRYHAPLSGLVEYKIDGKVVNGKVQKRFIVSIQGSGISGSSGKGWSYGREIRNSTSSLQSVAMEAPGFALELEFDNKERTLTQIDHQPYYYYWDTMGTELLKNAIVKSISSFEIPNYLINAEVDEKFSCLQVK